MVASATSQVASGRKIRSKRVKSFGAPFDMTGVAVVILGGGEGKRLYPLTLNRCKPAISFGGRYRLIDVPISNSIHSGCHKIFVITQFLSASLNHHLFKTYRQDIFHQGFLEVLSPELRPYKGGWFKGTADAIRQNREYLLEDSSEYFLILSGDQLYTMDYGALLQTAKETQADLVIASLPVGESKCKEMGILKIDEDRRIVDFAEKPSERNLLESLRSFEKSKKNNSGRKREQEYLGSMGIYLFKRDCLFKLLEEDQRDDFGKHLIPTIIEKGTVFAHPFEGYWEDIGTVGAFHKANIALTEKNPLFDCYDQKRPLYSMSNQLPGAKLYNALINDSIICEGSLIEADEVSKSVLGPRTRVKKGTIISHSYIMGNDYYEPPKGAQHLPEELQIGKNCILSNVILDKNVSIGDNVRLINKQGHLHYDGKDVFIRDGVIVVPHGVTISDGFIL